MTKQRVFYSNRLIYYLNAQLSELTKHHTAKKPFFH